MSHSLGHFHWVGEAAVFRCPICGDSKKNPRKTRGSFYKNESGKYTFKCHNCNAPYGFIGFMKTQFPELYKEHLSRRYNKTIQTAPEPITDRKIKLNKINLVNVNDTIVKLSELDAEHSANKYFSERLIPEKYRSILSFAKNYRAYILSQFVKDDAELSKRFVGPDAIKLPTDERIIIPFCDRTGKIRLVQGRSLDKNTDLRYITTKIDETFPKIFGLERNDPSLPTIVVEGPIDSLFIPNSIAVAGLGSSVNLEKYTDVPENKLIFVYDNQPRNRDVINQMANTISNGTKIVVWNNCPFEGKDINEMIMNGATRRQLLGYMSNHTFHGLRAKLELTKWSK